MFKIFTVKERTSLQNVILSLEKQKSDLEWDLKKRIEQLNQMIADDKERRIRQEERDKLQAERDNVKSIKESLITSGHIARQEMALHQQAKNMEAALIQSEVERSVAVAKLEQYEKMDAKDLRNKMTEFLGDAIKGLSKEKVIIKQEGII